VFEKRIAFLKKENEEKEMYFLNLAHVAFYRNIEMNLEIARSRLKFAACEESAKISEKGTFYILVREAFFNYVLNIEEISEGTKQLQKEYTKNELTKRIYEYTLKEWKYFSQIEEEFTKTSFGDELLIRSKFKYKMDKIFQKKKLKTMFNSANK
jgi:hypothetical protein